MYPTGRAHLKNGTNVSRDLLPSVSGCKVFCKERLDARPEVDLVFLFNPAVSFFAVQNPLDVRIVCPERIAKALTVDDRDTEVEATIGHQYRLLDLGSTLQR